MKILITGGAGFIGSRLAKRLLEDNHEIVVLDNLSPQVHGDGTALADFNKVKDHLHFIKGDVCSSSDVEKALNEVSAVYHLAAETGTGQSMYDICHYSETNVMGTANLLESIVKKKFPIEKIVLSSTRAVYGEGVYICSEHGRISAEDRSIKDLMDGVFEPRCSICQRIVKMTATDEKAKLKPTSIYGITKLSQEQLIMATGKAVGIPVTSLRYQNVYGPGQSLKNPYTGILAIFSNLIRQNKEVNIFEDGFESRDFVYIDDVVEATAQALKKEDTNYEIINIGTGVATTVIDIAKKIVDFFEKDQKLLKISGNFRVGDIRHNVADITKAGKILEFNPLVDFDQGLRNFLSWAQGESLTDGGYEKSLKEMKELGLFK